MKTTFSIDKTKKVHDNFKTGFNYTQHGVIVFSSLNIPMLN